MAEPVNEPGNPEEPSPEAAKLARIEAELRRAAVTIMRTQARRAWLVPLLAVPIVQLLTDPEVPAEFMPLAEDELGVARTAAGKVAAIVARITGDPGAGLTDDDAFALMDLVMEHRAVIGAAFTHRFLVKRWLGLPEDLSGRGLVRRLAQAIRERDEPPALLAIAIGVVLAADPLDPRRRTLVPLADSTYQDATRALDQRCFALGLRTWEDALRHAAATLTAEAWRRLLVTLALGMGREMASLDSRARAASEDEPPAPLPAPKPKGRRTRRAEPDQGGAERLVAVEKERDAARADVAAARQREAELVSARDRAQARVEAQEARVGELERELQAERGMKRALEADLRRLRGEPEPAPAPDVTPEPLPEDLLRGRQVFLFTGQARGGAREEMAESLRAIGADDLRVYHVDEGAPGPEVFPPGAVVVVDTRFMGHKHTADLRARVRRSPGAEYLQVQSGEGGLAARVAERLRRR